MAKKISAGDVTFLSQKEPIDEPGRALYAVSRSVLRAHLDQLTQEDLEDLDKDRKDVTMRQLSKYARLHRDKGMRGDGFEWAVHEAIVGGEPRVVERLVDAMVKASPRSFKAESAPTSLMFGYERAKYLGFTEAIVSAAADDALLLPDGQGRPFHFGPWVSVAAGGQRAEAQLRERIKRVWKTDLFVGDAQRHRHLAVTVKSNWHQLEGGAGLRLAVVPEASDLHGGLHRLKGLWTVALPDPDGFMGLFNDAYESVAESIITLGKHDRNAYYYKPSPRGQRLQEQLEKYGTAKVVDILEELDKASQQSLLGVEHKLVSVSAPDWLHMNAKRMPVIAPKPSFEPLK